MSSASQVGQTIPDFSAPASTGQTLSSDLYQGKTPLVIFFLPGLEADQDKDLVRQYDEHLAEFGQHRSQLLGVVKEQAKAVRAAAEEMDLHLPILADASGAMIREFGVDDSDGRARHALIVADKDGKLVRRFDPAPVESQVEAALATMRGIGTGTLRHP